MNPARKIGLGTAQWGVSYGAANRTGRPEAAEVSAMLDHARRAGVELLDTAQAYGDAERVLGNLRAAEGFRVFTKTLPVRANMLTDDVVRAVRAAFVESLDRLRCDRVDGLLVHHANDLLDPGGERLWDVLRLLKEDQRVRRIGVSVYHPEQLLRILDRFEVDVVQLPFSIYDQRFARDGVLADLKRQRVEVHARSVFLQGLLLLPPEELPRHFNALRAHQARLHRSLLDAGRTPLASALAFCLLQSDIDHVIVGCETLVQLQQTIQAAEMATDDMPDASGFALEDLNILDPSRWVP